MAIPENARVIEVHDVTFYAARQKMAYRGKGGKVFWRFGWNVFSSKGAFVFGGISISGTRLATFAACERELGKISPQVAQHWAVFTPVHDPFVYFQPHGLNAEV